MLFAAGHRGDGELRQGTRGAERHAARCVRPAARKDSPQALKTAQDLQREFGAIGEQWKTNTGCPRRRPRDASGRSGVRHGRSDRRPAVRRLRRLRDDCERLVHRARAGEIMLSLDFMKALGTDSRRSARRAAADRDPEAPAGADLRHRARDAPRLYVRAWRIASARASGGCAPETPNLRAMMNVGTAEMPRLRTPSSFSATLVAFA